MKLQSDEGWWSNYIKIFESGNYTVTKRIKKVIILRYLNSVNRSLVHLSNMFTISTKKLGHRKP